MKRKHLQGFTLIELLVSMTLMGLVMVAVQMGFRLGVKAWAVAQDRTEQIRKSESVFDLMSRQIGSLVPYYSSQEFEHQTAEVLLFHATPKGVRFVTPFSFLARGAGGLRIVEYFEADVSGTKGKVLIAQEWPLPKDSVLGERVFNGFKRAQDGEVIANFFAFSRQDHAFVLIEGLDSADFNVVPQGSPKERENEQIVVSKTKRRLPAGIEVRLKWKILGPKQQLENLVWRVPIHVVS